MGDVVLPFRFREKGAVAHKVEPAHPQTLFIEGLIVEGGILHHGPHADEGIMAGQGFSALQVDGIIAGGNQDSVPVGALIVQGSAHVEVLGFVGGGSAHRKLPFCIRIIKLTIENEGIPFGDK